MKIRLLIASVCFCATVHSLSDVDPDQDDRQHARDLPLVASASELVIRSAGLVEERGWFSKNSPSNTGTTPIAAGGAVVLSLFSGAANGILKATGTVTKTIDRVFMNKQLDIQQPSNKQKAYCGIDFLHFFVYKHSYRDLEYWTPCLTTPDGSKNAFVCSAGYTIPRGRIMRPGKYEFKGDAKNKQCTPRACHCYEDKCISGSAGGKSKCGTTGSTPSPNEPGTKKETDEEKKQELESDTETSKTPSP